MTDDEVAANLDRIGSIYRSMLELERRAKLGVPLSPADLRARQLALLERWLELALENVRA